ncbi:MAG: hypothetical protein R2856_27840 [Caldilineaceae bacterium]
MLDAQNGGRRQYCRRVCGYAGGLTIQNGASTSFGGGIYSSDTALAINSSQILSNSATDGGGGIYQDFNTLNISDSLISGNSARSGGGVEFSQPR